MYWVILLLITPVVARGLIAGSNILLTPGHLVGRQGCGTCQSNEKCCAGLCIGSDLDCCPDGLYYCRFLGYFCTPCPAGLLCVDINNNPSPWECCLPGDSACTFLFSNGSGVGTLVTSVGPATSLPSSAVQTSTYIPRTTSSPSPSPTPTTLPPSPSSNTPSSSSSPSPASTTLSPSPSPNRRSSSSSPSPTPTLSPSPSSNTLLSSSSPSHAPTTLSPSPSTNTPSPSPPSSPPSTAPSSSPSPTTKIVTSSIITPTISTSPKSPSSKASTSSSTGIVKSVNFITSTISTSTPSPYSRWDGSGPLLTGYCATPEFSLVDGAQTTSVFYIAVVGCLGDKTDCCPFQVGSTTTTVTAAGAPPPTNQFNFPAASKTNQATLPDCPADYETISSSVCCPSGYLLWNTKLGGITPCYSTTSNYLTPPPIAQPSTTDTGPSSGPVTVTSTVVNVVYAMNYPVNGPSGGLGGLSKGESAGIGIGSAAAALVGLALLYFCRWRRMGERDDESSPYSSRRTQDEISSPFTRPP